MGIVQSVGFEEQNRSKGGLRAEDASAVGVPCGCWGGSRQYCGLRMYVSHSRSWESGMPCLWPLFHFYLWPHSSTLGLMSVQEVAENTEQGGSSLGCGCSDKGSSEPLPS